MCAAAQAWGVPDVDHTIPRSGFHSVLRASLRPVVAVAAPSGYGKTIAVAQYCRGCASSVVWLSLNGGVLSPPQVLLAMLKQLKPGEALPTSETDVLHAAKQVAAASAGVEPLVLVLDDLASSPERPLLRSAEDLLQALSPFVERVIITARVLDSEDVLASRRSAVVDRRALLLSSDEADLVARQVLGSSADRARSEELAVAAGGHVALFRMLLTTGRGAEYERISDPDTAALMLVEQLLRDHFGELDRRVLEVTAMLKSASLQDIESLVGGEALLSLRRSSHLLPLVRWEDPGAASGTTMFRMHDLVAECVIHQLLQGGRMTGEVALDRVLEILAGRLDWERVRTLLSTLGDSRDVITFVERHGEAMREALASDDLVRIVGLASLQQAMGSPRFLLCWAAALYDVGEVNEALAKWSAARMLAEHTGDYETCGLALADRLTGLTDQGRLQEAIDDAERHLEGLLPKTSPVVRCQLLLSYAHALAGKDQVDEATVVLDRCESEALADPARCRAAVERLERYRVLMTTLRTGDWAYGASHIPGLLRQTLTTFVIRETLRGNLAWSFAELGRLSSAQSLLEALTGNGNALLDAAYYQIQAMILAARDDTLGALTIVDQGAMAASEIGDDADYNYSLLLKAAILRAGGMAEEALEFAERALEGLSRSDYFRYSHLAAIEVAASMVALGDTVIALRWLPPSTENLYNEVAMQAIRAVAATRQQAGKPDLSRLGDLGEYIRSGSCNWRLAMYCRCFPELLGLLAASVGAAEVPLHLLRMISTDAVETGVSAARSILSPEEWQVLGERALGREQFKEFVERAGKPICRVRLFGGLEVTADGRPVVEKDWKKRKARMLFAMLALRNGQDLSRDVILEHLWPHLTEDKAKNNFYVVWSTMKSALMGPDQEGACPYIESRRGRCRVVKEFVHTDVDDIDALFERIRQADAEGRTDDTLAALQELMSFYRGDLLPGDLYDDWFAAPRERYRFEFIDAMLKGAELLIERDDPYEALVFARRALMMDPFREDLYQAVLRCQILAGQRSAAIETFIQCKAQLAEELGLDPTAETQALYQQILAMEEKPRYDTYGLTDS